MPDAARTASFASRIVRWQTTHGRHTLPWQNTRDPYRVWLSEIMLQQTQVATASAYYARFIAKFDNVQALAAADEDEVLGLWSGLGYYSRARNLHRCAQEVVALHGGAFPPTAHALQTLPGIGRSTAAAIAAFCFGERVAILDANVKRVLTRVLAFYADLAKKSNEEALWAQAETLLPQRDLAQTMPRYTQGLMDLGATVCTSRQPQCLLCPVQAMCRGRQGGNPETYPVKSRTLKRSTQAVSLLWVVRSDGALWLEKRPATGVWGGLYCFGVFTGDDALKAAVSAKLHVALKPLPGFTHVLTHKDLQISVWRLQVDAGAGKMGETAAVFADPARAGVWFGATDWPQLGLPAPVRKLLENRRT